MPGLIMKIKKKYGSNFEIYKNQSPFPKNAIIFKQSRSGYIKKYIFSQKDYLLNLIYI